MKPTTTYAFVCIQDDKLFYESPYGDQLSSAPWKATLPYFVALDHLRSAFNVGSIFRTVFSGFGEYAVYCQSRGYFRFHFKKRNEIGRFSKSILVGTKSIFES